MLKNEKNPAALNKRSALHLVIFSVNYTAMPLILSCCTAGEPKSPAETCIARTNNSRGKHTSGG